jgi:hypothetical protein
VHCGVPELVRTHDGVQPAMAIGAARHDAPGARRSKCPGLRVADARVDGFANLIGTRLRSSHDTAGAVGSWNCGSGGADRGRGRRGGQGRDGGRGRLDDRRGRRVARRLRNGRSGNGRLDRSVGLRRRRGGGPLWQEAERIDVALIVRRHAHAEVDEWLGRVDDPARPHSAHDRTLGHDRSARDADRAEMDERGRVSGRRLNGDRLAAGRHRPRERDDAFGRREHVRTTRRAEVDAAMLARRVGVGVIERERTEHGSVDRPGPGLRRGNGQHERAQQHDSESREHDASLLPDLRTERP